jgi:hypothetical protein
MALTCTNQEILQVLDTGILPFGSPHSILYAPNGKLFIGSQTVPSIYILNNPGTSLSGGTTVSIPNYFGNSAGNTTATTYNSSNNKIYGPSYWQPYSLNPTNLTLTTNDPPVGQSLFADGNSCITNDGNNLFLGIGDNSIIKINLTTNVRYDFLFYNYKSQYPDLTNNTWKPHSMQMSPDNEYLIVSFFDNNGCKGGLVLKVKISDNSMSHVNISSVCPLPTDDIVVLGDYVYLGSEAKGDPPGTPFGCPPLNSQLFTQGVKVNWKTMQIEKIIPLSNDKCYTVATDNKFIYFGTANNKIIVYNPNSDETRTLSVNLPVTNLNELIYIGDNIWICTTFQSSSPRIFKLYINPFCELNTLFTYSDNTTSTSSDIVLTANSRNILKTLVNVDIGSIVISIGGDAFSECASLTSVTIPKSINSIGDSAFINCTNLNKINFLGNAPTLGLSVFNNTNANLKIYRKKNFVTGWTSTFGGKPVVLISDNVIKSGGTGKLTTKKRN